MNRLVSLIVETDIPRLMAALQELSRAFVKGDQSRYGMRIPAEPYRDGDLVCATAASLIEAFRQELSDRGWAERTALELQRQRDVAHEALSDIAGTGAREAASPRGRAATALDAMKPLSASDSPESPSITDVLGARVRGRPGTPLETVMAAFDLLTTQIRPAAWMRMQRIPSTVDQPPGEIEYECYAGDEPPEDGNKDWVPLYRLPKMERTPS